MIVVRLKGRLGNQLFQYAAGRTLSLRHDCPLKLDLTNLRHRGVDYRLDRFRIRARIAEPEEVSALQGLARRRNRPRRWLNRLFPSLFGGPHKLRFFRDDGIVFNPRFSRLPSHIYLDGYWAYWDYISEFAERIRPELRWRDPLDDQAREIADRIADGNSVSVHVRRGDYVDNVWHLQLSAQYFQSCANLMIERLKAPRFIVFSDDPIWVREHLRLPGPVEFPRYSGPEADVVDMRLMSLCRHHIIANSTYSWWAAWLNPRKDKIVLAPRHWVKDDFSSPQIRTPPAWDLIPDSANRPNESRQTRNP